MAASSFHREQAAALLRIAQTSSETADALRQMAADHTQLAIAGEANEGNGGDGKPRSSQ
jgi:hypothetical protein